MPPTLHPGDTGLAVSEAQYLLTRYIQEPAAVDGVFGPATEAAVQDYQQKFGLSVTGLVDPPTWTSLMTVLPIPPRLKLGSHGPVVLRLQRALNELVAGPPFQFLVEDGHFGQRTEQLIKEFQTQHGLSPDGVVGLSTWAASLGLANVRFATIVGL
jgi:peptidoglycan hydrolase-like protein with peptidoglycan-binding domain